MLLQSLKKKKKKKPYFKLSQRSREYSYPKEGELEEETAKIGFQKTNINSCHLRDEESWLG